MIFPNFDPFSFSRMSPRARMVQQLQGRGFGSFGLEGVTYTNGGQVGVLASTSRLGLLPERTFSPVVAPEGTTSTELTSLAPTTETAPRLFTRDVVDTSSGVSPTDSGPSPAAGTEETTEEGSVPQYASGSTPDEVDQSWGKGESNTWEGEAPRGDPLFAEGEERPPMLDHPPVEVVTQAGAQAAAPTGIPWWGYALGAAAAGFALYKLGGKKR